MDAFRQNFLEQVSVVASKRPSFDSLYDLLRLATPLLTRDAILREDDRKKAFRALARQIHPDMRQQEKRKATELLQSVSTLCEACCKSWLFSGGASNVRAATTSPGSESCPQSFHVQEKWPLLHIDSIGPLAPWGCLKGDDVAPHIVANCINARGAIAHGQKAELAVSAESMKQRTDAEELFAAVGGAKCLEPISSIKKELTENVSPRTTCAASAFSCCQR